MSSRKANRHLKNTEIFSPSSIASGRFFIDGALKAGTDGLLCESVLKIGNDKNDIDFVFHFSAWYSYRDDRDVGAKVDVKVAYKEGILPKVKFSFEASFSKEVRPTHAGASSYLAYWDYLFNANPYCFEKGKVSSWSKNIHPPINDFDLDRNGKVKVLIEANLWVYDPTLKLKDIEPTLEQAMRHLMFDAESSDLKIKCGEKVFPCHKFILGTRSDVFKTMFSSDLNVSMTEDNVLEIIDVSAETMNLFLKFLYTDDISPKEISCDLLIVADKYNFKRLTNICLKYLENNIETNNVMEITATAYLLDNDQLLQRASAFIFDHRGSIKQTEKWDQIKVMHPGIATKVMDLIVFDRSKPKLEVTKK